MLLQSSEIRWWSDQKYDLRKTFDALSGNEAREPDRLDFYLKNTSPNTGIKIREGHHELKLKADKDEPLEYGTVEHWIKWSHPAEKNILNTIKPELLTDWIPVSKKRWKKTYEIIQSEKVISTSKTYPEEGCGVEFTMVYFPSLDKPLYTFGLEAFSATGSSRKNLLLALEELHVDYLLLKHLDSFGYPEMLGRLF